MSYNWLNIIQQYLLPPTCILCGHRGYLVRDLCFTCYQHLPRNLLCCPRCALALEPNMAQPLVCGRCLSREPAYDETCVPFLYQGEIRYLITHLKFAAQYKNARLLGQLLAEQLKETIDKPDLLIPVPLHKARYNERGFNQAIEIARVVAKELQIPLELNACIRQRDTPHQTRLTAKQRRKNVKNAFALVKPLVVEHVAIVDDVMTTGSTAHELAVLLKKAGVKRVAVWACARA